MRLKLSDFLKDGGDKYITKKTYGITDWYSLQPEDEHYNTIKDEATRTLVKGPYGYSFPNYDHMCDFCKKLDNLYYTGCSMIGDDISSIDVSKKAEGDMITLKVGLFEFLIFVIGDTIYKIVGNTSYIHNYTTDFSKFNVETSTLKSICKSEYEYTEHLKRKDISQYRANLRELRQQHDEEIHEYNKILNSYVFKED